MSDGSGIEWTEATWNPVTGCTKVTQGCKNCYAEREWVRLSANPRSVYFRRAFTDVQYHMERLTQPLRWRRPRRVFVNSMSDLFHGAVSETTIADVFGVMAAARWHTFQVLTKRPAYMQRLLSSPEFWEGVEQCAAMYCDHDVQRPLPNVWLGVSAEDQATADERIPWLLNAPAAVRVLSAEPLLGPMDIRPALRANGVRGWDDGPFLDWVIAGGESGPRARPASPDWFRSLRDQCAASGAAFFFKQWGEWLPIASEPDTGAGRLIYPLDDAVTLPDGQRFEIKEACGAEFARTGKKIAGRLLDGRTHDAYPVAEVDPTRLAEFDAAMGDVR